MGTNNIVACFSSSIWTKEEKARAESLGFSVGDFKEYPVVSGSVFNEQYNETLDSAVIVLSQVVKEDRLSYIQPYDFVRIYDKSGNTGFDKNYLVDNYNETENNIVEHIFGYTINLMSETKLLEKIQCPNLVITHEVKDGVIGKKSIYQHIKQYMELYVPKIKFCRDGEHWEYEPLIKLPDIPRIESSLTISFDENDMQDIAIFGTNIRKESSRLPIVGIARNLKVDSFTSSVSPVLPLSNEKVSLDIWTNSLVYSAKINKNDIPTTTGQITFNFTEEDFRKVGNEYRLTFASDRFTNAQSVSVSSQDYVVDSDPSITFSGVSINYRWLDRRIHFVGYVNSLPESISGTITITYTYKGFNGLVDVNYSYDGVNDFVKRFDTPCADLPFNTPTLRQLLTELMMQVGCIPTVNNRTLGYLDFQKDLIPFGGEDYTVGHTVNKITRGLSSDSYVNTLVNTSSQVLDSGNEVICETLGFRDRNNFLLKQEENLYLETNFPIYKINKCILHSPGKYTGCISSGYGCSIAGYSLEPHWDDIYRFPYIIYALNSVGSGSATITFTCTFDRDVDDLPDGEDYDFPTYHQIYIKNNLIYFLRRTSNGGYEVAETRTLSDFTLTPQNTISGEWTYNDHIYLSLKYFNFNNLGNDIVGFAFSGYSKNSYGETQDFSFIRFDNNDDIKYLNSHGDDTNDVSKAVTAMLNLRVGGTRTWDITKLVVESQVRSCLDVDFDRMVNEIPHSWDANIDNISKYVYGTVGYNIGSNRIEGFSSNFTVGSSTATGWINKNMTYIENIIYALQYDFQYKGDLLFRYYEFLYYIPITVAGQQNPVASSDYGKARGVLISDYIFKNYSVINNDYDGNPFFTSMFVDLYYQPLNSFFLSYVKSKEAIDYSLEQYDGNTSGLTDFDRLSIHEQEQVDRVGNETLTISQRTDNYNDIQTFANGPLYFMDDTNRSGSIGTEDKGVKYTIFKRSFSINNNCFNVSYTGSKDAILKNYFTSIRTKYRAYEYVDYNNSTLRKEKDVFYVRIATDYYNGDDRIWWGSYSNKNRLKIVNLFYDLANEESKPISYECEYDVGLINTASDNSSTKDTQQQLIKNSVSLITTSNMFGIIYECPDNVGAGPYITDLTQNRQIGGIPQSWQLWDDSYNTKHTVTFTNFINFNGDVIVEDGNVNTIRDYVRKWGYTPIVDDSFININTSPNVIFSVVDDNSAAVAGGYSDLRRTFYKDVSERINHTVQFIYYAPNNDVLFGEDFISGVPMINRFNNPFNVIYGSDSFEFNSEQHNKPENDVKLADKEHNGDRFYSDYISITASNSPVRMTVHWNGYSVIKLCNIDNRNNIVDIVVFKRPDGLNPYGSTTYYLTVNDTKSDYVLAEKDGILYRAYTVKTYQYGDINEGRIVEPIYEDEEGE